MQLWLLLSALLSLLRCSDEVAVEIAEDKFDKYLYPNPPPSLLQRLDWRDRTALLSSLASNSASCLLLTLSFNSMHECALHSRAADCHHHELAVYYGLYAAAIWYAGIALELAVSTRRLLPVLRTGAGLLAFMLGYAETVREGLLYLGVLCLLSVFSVLLTAIPILHDNLVLGPDRKHS